MPLALASISNRNRSQVQRSHSIGPHDFWVRCAPISKVSVTATIPDGRRIAAVRTQGSVTANGKHENLKMALNPNQVKSRQPGVYADGRGLYLAVRDKG